MTIKITYFVHGTTIDNEKELATGWMPGELSKLGIKQARELGGLVARRKFDVVFCSDLKRAVDSTNIVFGDRYKIIFDKRLREINYGGFARKPEKEFKQHLEKYVDESFPQGESYKGVEQRMAEFLKFVKEDYDGKQIAIMGHQAPQLALEVLLNNKTWRQAIDSDWRKTKSWQPGWEYVIQ